MTEEIPPAAEKPKKKRVLTWKTKLAMLAIIERKRFGRDVNYKEIAARTGVKYGYIKHLWKEYEAGRIDLGEPQTPEEKEIDASVQHEKGLGLLKRYHALLLESFESGLIHAEDIMMNSKSKKGTKTLAFKEAGLPQTLAELERVMRVRLMTEKGYDALLDQLASRHAPKQAGPAGSDAAIDVQVVHANDGARAVAALAALETNGPTLSTSPSPSVPQ